MAVTLRRLRAHGVFPEAENSTAAAAAGTEVEDGDRNAVVMGSPGAVKENKGTAGPMA